MPSRSIYVELCNMARQMTECTRCLLVTNPYRPQKNSHAATKYGRRWRVFGIALFLGHLTTDNLFEIGERYKEERGRDFHADAGADHSDGSGGKDIACCSEWKNVGQQRNAKE